MGIVDKDKIEKDLINMLGIDEPYPSNVIAKPDETTETYSDSTRTNSNRY